MKTLLAGLFVVAALIGASPAACAVQPDEIMSDPVKEARARDLSRELRCMVCQNQSIDDSEAPLARDLRLLVRERIAAGDSDAQVLDFLVARYGEFVLLKPRFEPAHFAAVAAAAAGAGRRRPRAVGLSPAAPAIRRERRSGQDQIDRGRRGAIAAADRNRALAATIRPSRTVSFGLSLGFPWGFLATNRAVLR